MAAERWELLLALGRLGLPGALRFGLAQKHFWGRERGEVEAISPRVCVAYSSSTTNRNSNPLLPRTQELPREMKLGFHLPQSHCAMNSGHRQGALNWFCTIFQASVMTQLNVLLSLLPHWPEPQPDGAGGWRTEKPERAKPCGWQGILRVSTNVVS